MSENPLISVVIPVYNGEKYVKSCLENIFAQSYKNLEIIVVDDGSTDNTAQIAEEFKVRLFRQQNQGPSVARNRGIDEALGDYIHFMDVDDEINSEYYERMVNAIHLAGADIACGGMVNERHHFKTWKFKKQSILYSPEDKLRETFVAKWGYVWRFLFRLDFLKVQGLRFEEGKIIEDLIFALPAVYYANALVTVPMAEYVYKYRESSLMNKSDSDSHEKRRLDWTEAMAFRRNFAQEHNLKIPGVDTGRVPYLFRKVWMQLSSLFLKN